MFNKATQKNYKTSFDEYYAERRVISDTIVQADIGLTLQVSSPKYLICAHQAQDRINVPSKKLLSLHLIIMIFVITMLK